MEILLGGLVGVLMAASVWLMLSRDLVKFLFGLILIGNVANLVIFLAGGLTLGAPPLIGDGDGEVYANALPQALVLTAIVIGFGLVSFTLILAMRAWQALGTTDVEEMIVAERRGEERWVGGDRLGPAPAPDGTASNRATADGGAAGDGGTSGGTGDDGRAGGEGTDDRAGDGGAGHDATPDAPGVPSDEPSARGPRS